MIIDELIINQSYMCLGGRDVSKVKNIHNMDIYIG